MGVGFLLGQAGLRSARALPGALGVTTLAFGYDGLNFMGFC